MERLFGILVTSVVTVGICAASLPSGAAELELTVSVPSVDAEGGATHNNLRLGVRAGATDGFDVGQDMVVYLSPVLTASVSHPSYPAGHQSLWWDFRSGQLPQEWDLVVASDQSAPITLEWTAPATVVSQCASVVWSLQDRVANQTFTLTASAGPYQYSNQPGAPRMLVITAIASGAVTPSPPPFNLWSPRQGRTSVYLAWSGPHDPVAGYHVYRETPQGWRRVTAVPHQTTSYLDAGLDPSQSATYRVTAVDIRGCESTYSNSVVITPRQ